MKHIKISPQRYRWVIVAASFLMVFVCLGFCSSSKSLYLAAITEALGIKRSLFSINDSCRYIATAVVNLFFGALCARFGRKRLIAAGFACLIASMLLYAYAPNIYLFYLGGVLLGLGLAWTTTTMVGSIVHRWCPAHAGKIMGLILAANGVGAAVATQIVTPIIYAPGDAFGYRNAYKLVALILAVTAGIVLALYREPPEKIPESTSAEKEPQQAESGQSTARGARFYLLLVCVFLTGFILQSTTGVSAAHMKDVGLDAGYVAAVVSAHALSLTVCKFLTGVIHDHAGLRKTVLLCDCAAITVFRLRGAEKTYRRGHSHARGPRAGDGLRHPVRAGAAPGDDHTPADRTGPVSGAAVQQDAWHHRIRQYGRLRRRHADRQSDLRLSRHLSADAAGLRMRHGRRHDLHPAAA